MFKRSDKNAKNATNESGSKSCSREANSSKAESSKASRSKASHTSGNK